MVQANENSISYNTDQKVFAVINYEHFGTEIFKFLKFVFF